MAVKLNYKLDGTEIRVDDDNVNPLNVTVDGQSLTVSQFFTLIKSYGTNKFTHSVINYCPNDGDIYLYPSKAFTYASSPTFEFIGIGDVDQYTRRMFRVWSPDDTASNAQWESIIINEKGYKQMHDDGSAQMPVRITEAGDSGTAEWKYLILAHAEDPLKDSDCKGMIHVTGTLGAGGAQRKVDCGIDCRAGTFGATVGFVGYNNGGGERCGLFLCADYYNTDEENEGYYGRVYLILQSYSWYSFDLYIDGRQVTFLPEGGIWNTSAQLKRKISGYDDGEGYGIVGSEGVNLKGEMPLAV